MSRKRYTRHRSSGVEWLREIPEHWNVYRLRVLLKDYEGIKIGPFGSALRLEYIQEDGCKVYGQEHLINADFSLGHKYIDEDKFNELSVCEILPGDLVVSMMGTTGKCQVVPEDIERGIMDSHLLRLRPNELILPFYLALLINDSDYIRYQITTNGKGSIMEGLNSLIVKELLIALPPLTEQKSIAAFLDRETSHIDELIAKRQCQIELLQEKRSALISHVVTKGLDPNVKMKDSGVEWLGKIPEHWELKKLKTVVSLKSGEGITAEKIEENGQYPVYGGNGLRGFLDRYTHDGEFVLIGRQGALCGNINYAQGKFWVSEHAIVVTEIKPIIPRWMGELLRAMNLNQYSLSAAQPGIAVDRIREIFIPFPSFSEQSIIAAFLDRETSRIDELIKKVNKSIELLREYRTSLISAAVTGKIDVREEVA